MLDIFKRSLRRRLSVFIALLVALSVAAAGVLAFEVSQSALESAALARVRSVGESREAHIATFLRIRLWQLAQVSTKRSVIGLLDQPEGPVEALNIELVETAKMAHFASLSVVSPTGAVLASSDSSLVGSSLSDEEWLIDALERPGIRGLKKHAELGGIVRASSAVRHAKTGQVTGIIVGDVSLDDIYQLLEDRSGLGDTGETYLFDTTGLALSRLRFTPGAELSFKLTTAGAYQQGVVKGTEGADSWYDYRGVRVLGYTSFYELRKLGADWILAAEIDADEAHLAAEELRDQIAIIGCLSILAAAIIGYFVAGNLAKPVSALAAAAKRVGEGDLTIAIPDDGSKDEVGMLRAAFRLMTDNLRKMTSDLQDGVKTISTSSSEIAASAKQSAATASEQASTVAEVSTTTEELNQTSQAAVARAREVMQSAERALETGRRGVEAVDGATDAMTAIQKRVDDVAQKNRRLREQSAQIAEIIDAVQDLAEQSNLLAVNASIEAAKAGDQGRGFAVVASEVRSLAEQSKRATQQVRRILLEIQSSAEEAVAATEEGSRRVQDGTRAMTTVRSSIDELAATLEESADRSRQIAGAASQQAAGINQIAQAMGSLAQAGRDSVATAKQLEMAGTNLRTLGVNLRDLAARYRTGERDHAAS